MRTALFTTCGAAIALGAAALGIMAGDRISIADERTQTATPSGQADAARNWSKSDIEGIVRDYLVEHPELLIDMQTALQEKQEKEQQLAQAGTIEQASAEIFDSRNDAVMGNPDGDVTMVEFFDYNCGFCKRALPDMEKLIKTDPNLRFVLKEFPVLGPDSQRAHIVAMAFKSLEPDKYTQFHEQLLGSESRATEESAMKVAMSLGADEAALRKAMKSPEIEDVISQNYQLANQLQITGTPSYVIGNEVIAGALGSDVLEEKINAARNAE